MGKQRKQRQQPSKKKVQVKQKLAKQDPAGTAPAKKPVDAIAPEDANNTCVYGLNNLGNTCFFNSALQASPHNMSSSALQQEYMHSVLPGTEGGPAKQAMCHSLSSLARHVHVTGACTVQVLVSVPQLRDCCLQPMDSHPVKKGPIGAALQELVQSVYGARMRLLLHHRACVKQPSPQWCFSRFAWIATQVAPQGAPCYPTGYGAEAGSHAVIAPDSVRGVKGLVQWH